MFKGKSMFSKFFKKKYNHKFKILKTIPSDDGCIAIINPNRYESFFDNMPSSTDFLEQAKNGNIFLWGVARGNWNIEISNEEVKNEFQSESGLLVSDGKVSFVTYDELSMAGMYKEENRSLAECDTWSFDLPKGSYICTVGMMFNPEIISEVGAIESENIHFHVCLKPSQDDRIMLESISWYDFDTYV